MTCCVLFPSQLFDPCLVEEDFATQAECARAAGFDTLLLDQEKVDAGDYTKVARSVRRSLTRAGNDTAQILAAYRGWMLTVAQYESLYAALFEEGIELINSPEAYAHCHLLPESFDIIREHTPHSVWIPMTPGALRIDEVVAAAAEFGDAPVIIKDYVKSRKHEWDEACFVPKASDQEQLREVVTTFVERQETSLVGGVVVREFIELERVGTHAQSGMPLTREHRVFVLDGEPIANAPYWDGADYADGVAPLDGFTEVMKSVRSRLFTMDLALGTDGVWRIIELGDGQVAGLLDTISPEILYATLASRLL
ncbi:MAG: hypothetical protein ACI9KE_002312 [Polyangiales bacterium]|jgi:hypothetical protein